MRRFALGALALASAVGIAPVEKAWAETPVPMASSPEEVGALRKIVGHQMHLVTPGIRPEGSAAADQKRVMTPAAAIRAGASHLVVGRPIVAAPDPCAAAERIIAEMTAATP